MKIEIEGSIVFKNRIDEWESINDIELFPLSGALLIFLTRVMEENNFNGFYKDIDRDVAYCVQLNDLIGFDYDRLVYDYPEFLYGSNISYKEFLGEDYFIALLVLGLENAGRSDVRICYSVK